jgi:hypothetical protein
MNKKKSGYNSIGSSRRWLNGTRDHHRNAEGLKSLRIILMFLLVFLGLYVLVLTIKGYHVSPIPGADEATAAFVSKTYWYFLASGVVCMVAVIVTMIAVIRESPTLSMLCSIFMLVAVAQSLSNVLHNLSTSWKIMEYLFVSPAAIMCLIACLLTIYTSLIWSAEFETPPHVIEEYKWYLNQIRTGSELNAGRLSTPSNNTTLSVSAGPSASTSQVLVTRSNFNSMDDLTSLSYHSSKSFT